MGYTVHSASRIFTENCYYDGGGKTGNIVCDWIKDAYPGYFADEGSITVNCKRTNIGQGSGNYPSYAQKCTWRPNSNYSYTGIAAKDTKSYCTTYSGAQSSGKTVNYVYFKNAGIPSASYITAGGTMGEETTPTEPNPTETTQPTDPVYATVQGAVNDMTYDASWVTPGKIDQPLKVNDMYTIMASAEKNVNSYAQSNSTSDKKFTFTCVTALGGAGDVNARSLQINAKSAGTFTGYLASSGRSETRTAKLLDAQGNVIQTVENIVGDAINPYTFTIPAAGTYYITSASSGLNIYHAYFTPSAEQPTTEPVEESETAKLHCYTDSTKSTQDYTHLSVAGAAKIASIIKNELVKLNIALSDYAK